MCVGGGFATSFSVKIHAVVLTFPVKPFCPARVSSEKT